MAARTDPRQDRTTLCRSSRDEATADTVCDVSSDTASSCVPRILIFFVEAMVLYCRRSASVAVTSFIDRAPDLLLRGEHESAKICS